MITQSTMTQIKRYGFEAQDILSGLLYSNTSEIIEIIQAAGEITQKDITDAMEDISQPSTALALKPIRRARIVTTRTGTGDEYKYKFYRIDYDGIQRINRITKALANH